MSDLREPPQAAIMTGYMLEKAQRRYLKYLWDAFQCLTETIQEMKDNGDDVNLIDVANEREAILSAMADAMEVSRIHRSLSEKLLEYGYRKITDADFAQHGAGGSR